MSLIPFILELADELHEFNRCLATGGMDVDDFGFGIYPHELQPQQQSQQSQHPLPQQQPQQHRRPRSLSQFYWLSNLSKSRHHPYYRGKPCCNKTPIHLVHDHQLEKDSTPNAGSGGGVFVSSPTGGTSVGDKEPSANTHATNSSSTNISPTTAAGKSAYSVVNKNGFQVSMNVKQFAPNELTVKTIDNCIVVEGQHEDKEDGHGVISRHFIRKYMLPKGYDPSEVLSTLSSDGILTVKAPPPPNKTDETMERIVDIQQTGTPVQIQQTTVNITNSGKEDQVNAASLVEQSVSSTAAVTGTLPASVKVTLPQQKKEQSQQLSATAECVQQQQQQPTTKDLVVTHEHNGNNKVNELTVEQQTEQLTAEHTVASSNTNVATNNNNNNNCSNTTVMNKSVLNDSTASKANLKTDENGEKESSAVDEEKTVEIDKINVEKPLISNVATTSSIDAIMATPTSDEPMETEEEEIVKEDSGEKLSANSVPTTDVGDAAIKNVNNINSVANSSTASINNSTTNNISTTNDSLNMIETNGIDITTSKDVEMELASTALPEAKVTNNGVSPDSKTANMADGITISLETEVTEMDAEVTDVAVVVDGNADGITIGIDIGSGVNVSVVGEGGNSASVEDGNDENISAKNLVVAAQSPSAADLVAAADAAILLAKTKCDVVVAGTGDVTVSKTAITTEEIAN